jgi:uncharacterized protein YciW
MNIQALEDDRNRNRKQRLEFITKYARWVKNTPNQIWSKQQKELIDSVLLSANKIKKEGIRVRG